MSRMADVDVPEGIVAEAGADPATRPSFTLKNRLRRACWNLCHALLYRPSPRPMHAWRAFLLRCFGAQLGPHCHFYPRSIVWAPWNLRCEDAVGIGDGAEIYNPAPVELGSHVILSQDSYLCGATHDLRSPAFPLLAFRMRVEAYAWICARACVGPGVQVGEGAVLGLGAVATRDLEPWTVYGGNPAQPIGTRPRTARPGIADPAQGSAA